MCRESAMEYGAIVRYDCRLRHLRTTEQFRFLSLIETPYALWSTGKPETGTGGCETKLSCWSTKESKGEPPAQVVEPFNGRKTVRTCRR